jgi:hypothetical protein
MACVAMKPAFGDQSAWRFFHAWLCLEGQAWGFVAKHEPAGSWNLWTYPRRWGKVLIQVKEKSRLGR